MLVEGLSFFLLSNGGQGFDKLSPNGDLMHFSLLPHPDVTPPAGREVQVFGGVDPDKAVLNFVVTGSLPAVSPVSEPNRTDGLWRTTCFELFVQPVGESSYFEFNFSPSRQWAAYSFGEYRQAMRELPLRKVPGIEPIENGMRVVIDLSGIPAQPWRVGLAAVIEETDGTKSYWALAHPPGPPDFHNAACFTATLPAAECP